MANEILKYNPANITPEHFMNPPTKVVHPELRYLIAQVAGELVASNMHNLFLGTEIEVFIFSPDRDPSRNSLCIEGNPNYSAKHLEKLRKIHALAKRLKIKYPQSFLSTGRMGRIFLEFRTLPQNIDDHLSTMMCFIDQLRNGTSEIEVLPVVHSQHIHVSLFPDSRDNINGRQSLVPDSQRVVNTFSSVTPFMLLPEEWNCRNKSPFLMKKKGLIDGKKVDLLHPEFRLLSSEYAHDYLLNILMSLRAMQIGCSGQQETSPRILDSDYSTAVSQLGHDKDLKLFFGESTLAHLCRIVGQYPRVTSREITVDQIV